MGYSDKKPTAEEQAAQVKSLAQQLEEAGGVGSKAESTPTPKRAAKSPNEVRREVNKRAEAAMERDKRTGGRPSRDEQFGAAAVAAAKAALAHRKEDEEAKTAANEQTKTALTQIGVATVENPFTNGDFKGLVGYLQEAILDPRVTVGDDRVPLGSLRALQNVVDVPSDEANGAMHAFIKQRYDTTGLLLKAQAMIADAHNGDERSIRFSPGGLEWAERQLRRIAGELAEGEGFDAQRRVAGYEALADKVQNLRSKVFGNTKDTNDSDEADASDES